jgi:UDP-N-acetylglucosamine 2-epimerase (non-hydrolysing)
MIDTLMKQMPNFRKPPVWNQANLEKGRYIVLTLHRPANVDDQNKLHAFLREIATNACNLPLVFPVHPRTAKILAQSPPPPLATPTHFCPPLGYLEFNYLVKHAMVVITDSGGITEETTVMGVPCMTLRDNTERPETVTIGTNELIGTEPAAIGPAMQRLFAGKWKKGGIPEKWDGRAGERIADILVRRLGAV